MVAKASANLQCGNEKGLSFWHIECTVAKAFANLQCGNGKGLGFRHIQCTVAKASANSQCGNEKGLGFRHIQCTHMYAAGCVCPWQFGRPLQMLAVIITLVYNVHVQQYLQITRLLVLLQTTFMWLSSSRVMPVLGHRHRPAVHALKL